MTIYQKRRDCNVAATDQQRLSTLCSRYIYLTCHDTTKLGFLRAEYRYDIIVTMNSLKHNPNFMSFPSAILKVLTTQTLIISFLLYANQFYYLHQDDFMF